MESWFGVEGSLPMLSVERNGSFTSGGAGAQVGEYLPRHGLPALRDHELPQPSRGITQTRVAQRLSAPRVRDRWKSGRSVRSVVNSGRPRITAAESARLSPVGLLARRPDTAQSAGGTR